jgi:hypothetical protein
MRIYGLLDPSQAAPPPAANPVAPIMQAPGPQASAHAPAEPEQQASFITDFFSTPHPIGSATKPAAPAPDTNAAGKPAFADKAANNTFLGDINRALAPATALKP